MKRRYKTIFVIACACAAMLLFKTGSASASEATYDNAVVPTATAVGWQSDNGIRYYIDAEANAPLVGEQQIDGEEWLFDFTGAQKTGWRTVNGIRRFYDPDTGEIVSGWITYGGYRYYADKASGKQTGEIEIDGLRYLLDENCGYQHLGFCTFADGTVSYYDVHGKAVTGWMEYEGNSYYLDRSCRLVTGWQTIAGNKYYFDKNGVMQTGWKTIAGKKYYFNKTGAMRTMWQTIGGQRYYFGKTGVMRTMWETIGGQKYYFGKNGVMHTGWQHIDDHTYYFYPTGVCATGECVIDGTLCRFSSAGRLVQKVIAWQQGDGSEEQRKKHLTGIAAWQNHPWTVTNNQDQTIGSSGCGLFSVINSVYYKTENFLHPVDVADWAKAKGYRTANSGVSDGFFQAYANAFGSSYGFRFAGRMYSTAAALQHIRNGGTICANIPGHWIAVVDYDSKTGKYLLLDSAASYPRCKSIPHWESTGVAWVSASTFTQNPEYQLFTGTRKVYALSYW